MSATEDEKTLETPAGPVVVRPATKGDLPFLDALVGDRPKDMPVARQIWGQAIEGGEALVLSYGDRTPWGFLAVTEDMDGVVTMRWLTSFARPDAVAPTLVAAASDLVARGLSPVHVRVREKARALVDDLKAAGFEVDGERTRDGQVVLSATRLRLAHAAEVPTERAPLLAEATDDELVAEVRRRRTMAGAVYALGDVREELRLGEHGIAPEALDDAARGLLALARTGLADAMEKSGIFYLAERWDALGERVLAEAGKDGPTP